MIRILLAALSLLCLQCGPKWETADEKHLDSVDLSVNGVIDHVNEEKAKGIARYYISHLKLRGTFPPDAELKPYFFEPEDLGEKFRLKQHVDAVFRDPATILAEFDNGLRLRFCFHKMIINIDKSDNDECPFDFNREPRLKP